MELMEDGTTIEQQMFAMATEKKVPLYGVLELLPLCNLNCDMCYVRMSREEMEEVGRLRTMEEWTKTAEDMMKAGTLFVLLTGGEPLLYPHFRELYQKLRELGMIITINTNGTLIDEAWADFFAENKPRRINITLYGASNETYERLCHYPGGFDKAVNGIRLLRERNIDVKVNGSLAKANVDDRMKIIELGESLDAPVRIDTYMYPSVRERNHAYNNQARLDPEMAAKARVEVLQREMGEEVFAQYRKIQLDEAENTPEGEAVPGQMACRAGKSSFVVNWQGEMRSCVVLDKPSIPLRDVEFEEAWKFTKKETDYQSKYVASATVSVTSVGGMDYVNAQSAQQMAEVFPYILTSGVLKDVVAEDMGLDSMPGSIDVKADDGTNLLTISVSGNDPQMAYKTLKSVIKNYPKVAEFVLGETKLTILDETGIPTDTKRVEVIRGSYKRGALKGAIIGCVILLLYVLSRRTVKSRKDLKKNINLQDLGSIPYVRTKKRKKETFYNSVSLLNERISMSYLEAIRKLRIRIMKDVEKKEYQTLLVTSSIPGEGKTTLSANLAISIAQQGKKVLLVDCDLRNPSIAGVMNEQEPHPGLGSVLKKEVPLSEAITNVKLPKERTNENGSLHVIFGGAPDRENSLLIGSGRMRALIKALKSKYDIIILDTAPSELLADAPLLGKYVDAALYVIRYDYTKLREIREGVESLALSGIDMLGYVFNGDNSSGGQGYGYGYRRYGSYGSHYGSYGKYGAYGHYGKMEKGSTDKFGRVIKD